MSADRLPMHIAVHYLTNADFRDGGVAVNVDAGRIIGLLAERVREVTLLAYEPPPVVRSFEDATPYLLAPKPDNLHIVTLGPKGGMRSYVQRRKAIRDVIARSVASWDVLLLRLINRRAELVWRAASRDRLVTQVGGSRLALARGAPPARHRLRTLAAAAVEEFYQRRIISDADLTFVVGEDLLARYGKLSDVSIIRESGLHDRDIYERDDRLDRADAKFMFSGQLQESKGIFEMVDAFARIRGTLLPDATLHVVGEGPDEARLRRRIDELGIAAAVNFHAWIGDRKVLLDLYREMDVLFCLSHTDFMPRVVWEALGSSVLVVATRVGALPHAFTDRTEVLFVATRDPDAAVEGVRTLLEDPPLRRAMIRAGMSRARQATLEVMVDAMLTKIVQRWPELGGGA